MTALEAPRVPLGTWPTPLEPAPRLAVAIGLEPADLWIKHDDLTGLGGGGNKVRKLEYCCGAALAHGADTLLTCGAPQSNHARLTAAAGARLGLKVELVLAGSAPESPQGNLLLDGLLDARVHFAGVHDVVSLEQRSEARARELSEAGATVEVIPYGGSSSVSARGYSDCAGELIEQAPDLEHVVVAVGSGGTMAGLVHALGTERVLGVNVGAVSDPRSTVTAIVEGMRAGDTVGYEPPELRMRMDQVGGGYADLTDDTIDAIQLAARTEGLLLDPVYTGRALAGLRSAIADGTIRPGRRTVFLHSGGLPGTFGHARSRDLAGKLWP